MDLEQIESGVEHSPLYSDNSRSWSWNQFGNDVNSFGDSTNELCGLVEDKEIAARAVAFVVNSTRKGIVPLCADVANLMRSKQCLERKLYLLRKENEVFRSSASAGSVPSHSMSPTPLSVSSYTESCMKALQEQTLGVQDRYRSSSRCSNSSSTYSYSPKLDRPRAAGRLCGVHYSPASSHDSKKHGSPRTTHSNNLPFKDPFPRTFFPASTEQLRRLSEVPNPSCEVTSVTESSGDNFKTVAHMEIKPRNMQDTVLKIVSKQTDEAPCETNTECVENQSKSSDVESNIVTDNFHVVDETKGDNCDEESDKAAELRKIGEKDQSESDTGKHSSTMKTLLERRRVSLPEMITVPNLQALKIRPKQSKLVQCSLPQAETSIDQALEEQFVKSVKLNAKLEEELCEARKEIDQLRKRLKKLESGGAIPKTHCYRDDDKITEDNGYYTGSNRTSRNSSEHERSSVSKKPSPKRQAVTPVTYGGPLPNCRCASCQEALGSDDDLSHYSDVYLDEPHRYAVNSKLQVQVDDHVITKSNISGCIRYIGHLDKTDLPNTLFIGLELDEPVGSHDGCYMGKRYFCCRRNHGVFLPLNDVISKGGKKSQSKSVKDESARIRKHLKKLTGKDEKLTHL